NTVYVYNGSYTENVDVDKRLTLRGEGADVVTVTAASSGDHVFEVTADWMNISGFNVTGATGSGKVGIYLCDSQHCNISDINAAGNCFGIYLTSSSNYNTLANNTANSNEEAGIYLSSSSDNNITDNTASQTVWGYGIYMSNANNNKLTNNNASYNTGGSLSYGIYLTSSSDNTFSNNTANSNPCSGIWLNSSSNNNTFTNNTASNNNYIDFYSTPDSRNNTVEDLLISSYPTTVSFIYGNGVGLKGVKKCS
ncbi:CASH domain-dontaining protein, partial [Candidatus Methanophagaceae archaeon]